MSGYVTGKRSAVIDGKETSLAGCDADCEFDCLRKDHRLFCYLHKPCEGKLFIRKEGKR